MRPHLLAIIEGSDSVWCGRPSSIDGEDRVPLRYRNSCSGGHVLDAHVDQDAIRPNWSRVISTFRRSRRIRHVGGRNRRP